MEYSIETLNIGQEYDSKKVLNEINLQIGTGEIFGLLGPSGAGKTTLIKILTGQIEQTWGTAMILGKNTRKLKGGDYKKIGIMMDSFGVYERLSCYDNLKLFAQIYGIKNEKINEALSNVGLLEARKTLAMNLSKGMRSRLILARVLMINPSILFLDEPTSGLDPATMDEIHKLILKEKDKGITIFLTTHNMVEAEKLCDHVALLNEGNIVEYGTPVEICRKYNHQKKIKIHLYNGENIELLNDKSAAGTVENYLEHEMIETIHSTEPNLETVFMELTGRGFE